MPSVVSMPPNMMTAALEIVSSSLERRPGEVRAARRRRARPSPGRPPPSASRPAPMPETEATISRYQAEQAGDDARVAAVEAEALGDDGRRQRPGQLGAQLGPLAERRRPAGRLGGDERARSARRPGAAGTAATYGSRWRACVGAVEREHARPDDAGRREPRVVDGERRPGRAAPRRAAARPVTRYPPMRRHGGDRATPPQPGEVRVRVAGQVVDGRCDVGVGHRVTADDGGAVRAAQRRLEHLAGGVARQLVDDLDARRALEVGQPLPGEGDQLGGRDLAVAGDGGDDRLAPALVGQPEDGHLADGRVAHEDLLDLDRVDVLAAGDDHVLLAVDERDVAVLVDLAEVAGVEPAAAERLGRRLRQHPVPGEDVLAAHEQLADLAHGDVAVVGVDEARLDVQQRAADRAELVLDVLGVEHGHGRRRLGQPEALLERHAAIVEELDQRQRRRGAAGQRHVERRQVVVVEAGERASAPPTSPARGTAASPGARPSRRGRPAGRTSARSRSWRRRRRTAGCARRARRCGTSAPP